MTTSPQRYGFALQPRFSLLGLASATEVLRVANEMLGGRSVEALLLSADGRPVISASGESLSVSAALATRSAASLAGLFVVADSLPDPAESGATALTTLLGELARQRGVLGGIGTGAAWLAHAGVLRGYRCTLPAMHVAHLSAACPSAIVSGQWYEIDRNRLTCAGGHSAADLLIAWLGQLHGERLTQRLLAHFGLERLRDPAEHQTPHARSGAPTKLAEAVALMESNLGEPLSTEDIAGLVGVSRRQLERLFKQHLDTLPSRWYLEQRLNRARSLLQQTAQSVLQIGLSCGFASGAHFSNAYRNYFGRTPRDERSERAMAWRASAGRDVSGADSAPLKEPT